MANFNSNMNPSAIQAQIDEQQQTKQKFEKTQFDAKNYLNVRLGTNETSKTLTIRLLPSSPESTTPFEKVHMHTIKVNKEIAESGWKSFVCPVHNHMGTACPFCDVSDAAKKMFYQTNNEKEKENYKEIANLNRSREMWIARCIERGHEEDGVKFWLMSGAKDGPYNKIMNVWSTRMNRAKEKGTINDIFDLNNGKDIDVTITRSSDGKNVISVVDSDERTPLTEDFNLGMSWINDSKRWSDVYKVKPVEYMSVIAEGGIPVFDKVSGKYVNRDDAKKAEELAAQEELNENLTAQSVDYTQMPQPQVVEIFQNNVQTVSEADLPF